MPQFGTSRLWSNLLHIHAVQVGGQHSSIEKKGRGQRQRMCVDNTHDNQLCFKRLQQVLLQ